MLNWLLLSQFLIPSQEVVIIHPLNYLLFVNDTVEQITKRFLTYFALEFINDDGSLPPFASRVHENGSLNSHLMSSSKHYTIFNQNAINPLMDFQLFIATAIAYPFFLSFLKMILLIVVSWHGR